MPNKTSDTDRYRAPALDKGLDIIELMATQRSPMTRAEIVRAIGRSPSEIYRMLERLVARDYISRSTEGDRFSLTMKLFTLGSAHPPLRRISASAQPLLDIFAERTMQSIHLVVVERGLGIVVARASGLANWEYHLRLGAQLDLATTSSGKTLLAFQDLRRRPDTLAIWGVRGLEAALEALEPEFKRLRQNGYRMDASPQLGGVTDISVPVLGPSGDAIAVITCPHVVHIDGTAADRETALNILIEVSGELSLA